MGVIRLRKDIVVYGLGGVLNRAIGLLLIPLYTQYLTVAEYGLLGILGVCLQLITFLGLLGVGSASVRYFFDDSPDVDHQRKLFGNATLVLIVWPLGLAALLFAIIQVSAAGGLINEKITALLLLIVLCGLFTPLSRLLLGLFRARQRSTMFITVNILFFLLQFVLIYWLVGFEGRGIRGQVTGQAIANGAFFIVALAFLASYGRFKVDEIVIRRLLVFGLPLVPFFMLVWANTAVPRLFVQATLNLESVGIFFLATQFAGILGLVNTALDNALAPHFFRVAGKDGGATELGDLVTKYVGLFALLGLLVIAGTPYIIRIVADEQYHEAIRYVGLLTTASYIHVLSSPVFWSLNYSEQTGTLSILRTMSTAILSIGLLLIFLTGTASIMSVIGVTIISNCAMVGFGAKAAQRHFRLNLDYRKVFSAIAVFATSTVLIDVVSLISSSTLAFVLSTGILVLAASAIFRITGFDLRKLKAN